MDPTETARRVLDLDKRRAELDALDVAVDLANAAPELARALIESQAALAKATKSIEWHEHRYANECQHCGVLLTDPSVHDASADCPIALLAKSQAALAAATEEQSRAWALLTGEKWTQTRAEGSLVEAAARMRDQLAAANARAETADRQIAVHEASAKEQLRLSLAVGAAMREVTQTEIGSGNHAAARARWEEAKKKFAAFQLAPLAGPLERIEAERDALRDDLARVTADLAQANLNVANLNASGDSIARQRDEAESDRRTLRDQVKSLRADLATARESVRELVDGLQKARAVMALCGPSRERLDALRDQRLPEDAAVRSIAHLGYGAIMDAAARLWCDYLESQGLPWGAAHSKGPCVETALDTVASLDALLAKHAAPAPPPADAKETPAAVPGLVFGEPDAFGNRVTPRPDDTVYVLGPSRRWPGEWEWCVSNRIGTCRAKTESEAIAAASAHNAARLKGGE